MTNSLLEKPRPKLTYPDDFINKIICGDCLEVMKNIPDNSIDLVVTSPPYDNLRDYGGYSFDFGNIAKELFRIIKDGGVVVWVVGDATINGSETGTSFKQVLFFKEIGFNLHDTMVYEKSGIPFPSNNRYYQSFEFMFILSKGTPKKVNLIQDKKNKYGLTEDWGKRTERRKDGNLIIKEKVLRKEFGVRNNIWRYKTGKGFTTTDEESFNHPAIFPETLAKDHIISWSNKDDIVLDSMCGSGTTCKMAKKLGRNFIGIEISPEYCKIVEERLKKVPLRLDNILKEKRLD